MWYTSMMTQNVDKKRAQIQMFYMDDMVPQDHLLSMIDKAIDWSFIYDLVVAGLLMDYLSSQTCVSAIR